MLLKKSVSYFVLGTILWFIVDLTTTGAIKNPIAYYSTYMPTILIFYLGYPLVFSVLIYRYRLADKYLFIATMVCMLIIEVGFTHNSLLFTFPVLFIAIPSAVGIYCLLTFFPKWVVDNEIHNNTGKIALFFAVYLFISFLTYFGS